MRRSRGLANWSATGRTRSLTRKPAICPFCTGKAIIDYKDVATLSRYLTSHGSIGSRHTTRACAKHQRALARAIKRARFLALLPYAAVHIWKTGGVGLPASRHRRS